MSYNYCALFPFWVLCDIRFLLFMGAEGVKVGVTVVKVGVTVAPVGLPLRGFGRL